MSLLLDLWTIGPVVPSFSLTKNLRGWNSSKCLSQKSQPRIVDVWDRSAS